MGRPVGIYASSLSRRDRFRRRWRRRRVALAAHVVIVCIGLAAAVTTAALAERLT